MKIFIEDYKGQTINYDDYSDKFVCDIEIDDNVQKGKRGSLSDMRKQIDIFIKENVNFKPFKAIIKESYSSDFSITDIVSIRVDRLLVSDNGGRKSFIGQREANKLCVYDQSIIDKKKEIDNTFDQAYKAKEEGMKALVAMLKSIDVSKYNLS